MFQLTCLAVILASIFQLGVQQEDNCLNNPITSAVFSATDYVPGFPPSDGFLDNPSGAWCSQTAPPDAYLQVNLNNLHILCAVEVQGFANSSTDFFTTKYKLSYTLNNNVWAFFVNESHQIVEFPGSSDNGNSSEISLLPASIRQVKGIRVHPTEINGSLTCLRVAVYGKKIFNATCDSRLLRISIIRGGLGPDIATVHMNDATPACSFPVSHDSDTSFSLPVGNCGAQLTSNEKYLYVANTVHGKVVPSEALVVTRTYDVSFKVNCSFARNGSASTSYVPNPGFSVTGTEYGAFSVSIEGYLDANLTDELDENDSPLALDTEIFIQMKVIANDTDVTLHARRCWATPNEDRNDATQRDLIVLGCPVESNVTYTCDNTSVQTFEVLAFRFESTTTVYIHCNVLLCLPDAADNTCKEQCDACSTNPGVVRRSLEGDGLGRGSQERRLDFGPFYVEEQKDSIPRQPSSTGLSTQTVIIMSVVGPVVFLVLCATVAATVIVLRKVRNTPKSSQAPPPPQASMESPILSVQDIWVNI